MSATELHPLTVRFALEDLVVLVGVAKLRKQPVAVLARELLVDQLRNVRTEDIDAAIEADRQRLIEAVHRLRVHTDITEEFPE